MKNLFKPFQQFFQLQSASGILLLAATLLAFAWANSPWADLYERLWQTSLSIGLGGANLSESLHFWINDGLMAVFFLVVGLEIKRELRTGELSTPRKATLPLMAALGGMIAPALIYGFTAAMGHPETQAGWGIPTVTDIAFALGVLAILGDRVPVGLKVFLTALAIVDDLGAILLIALFYSHGLHGFYLLLTLAILLLLLLSNRLRVHRPLPYLVLGILLWVAVLKSGLHATLAGVLLAMAIPSQSRIVPQTFLTRSRETLARFQQAGHLDDTAPLLTNAEHQASVQDQESLCEAVQSPLQKFEHALTPWVSYAILPLFALSNAGLSLSGAHLMSAIASPVSFGIVAGLFLGKQLGILSFSWFAVQRRWAELPEGVSWSLMHGASLLGGIGFTMSLFIAMLAFEDPSLLADAKTGILAASLLSGTLGTWRLHRALQSSAATPDSAITETSCGSR
jgi:NhaA family Na+:H+ antiporter